MPTVQTIRIEDNKIRLILTLSTSERCTWILYGMKKSLSPCCHDSSSTTSERSRSKQIYRRAAKHSLFPISTKYESSSSAISVDAETAAVTMASLYNLSCFDKDIDSSHRPFF